MYFIIQSTVLLSLLLWPALVKGNGILGPARRHVHNPLYGDKYVLAAPRMAGNDGQIMLVLYSSADQPVAVSISMAWAVQKDSDYHYIQLKRLHPYTHIMNRIYSPTVEIGFTWTYYLSGTDNFGVTILLIYGVESVATIQTAPIIAWGKEYFAVTLSPTPFIEILSYLPKNVVEIKIRATGDFNLPFQNRTYYNGDTFNIVLNHTEAFILSYCESVTLFSGALTGTRIKGVEPVGVLSGSCRASTKVTYCNTQRVYEESRSDDMVAEMMMPTSMYGKRFIDLAILDRKSNGMLYVIAGEDSTTINFRSHNNTMTAKFLAKAGDYMPVYTSGIPSYFVSDKGILAVYLQSSACLEMSGNALEMGDVAMSILVPIELFYDSYVWATPRSDQIRPINYVAVVSRREKLPDLRLDFEQIRNFQHGTKVFGFEEWCVSNHHVHPGGHMLTAVTTFTFGCYVFGFDMGYAYMHSAGYLPSPINLPCQRTNTSYGDLIDNDCDGYIDEEEDDNKDLADTIIDNDNDRLIDEDLKITKRVSGVWSEWTAWACTWNCSDTRVMRKRYCENPQQVVEGNDIFCDGEYEQYNESNCHASEKDCGSAEEGLNDIYSEPALSEEWSEWYCSRNCSDRRLFQKRKCRLQIHCRDTKEKTGNCYEGKKCPADCTDGKWGVDCLQSCVHCADVCDKYTGLCQACKDGYEFPSTSCNKPCNPFFYGAACQHSCKQKCGEDCLDRQEGTCPEGPYLYIAIIPVAVTLLTVTYIIIRKQHGQPPLSEDKGPIIEDKDVTPLEKGSEVIHHHEMYTPVDAYETEIN